LKLTCKTSS